MGIAIFGGIIAFLVVGAIVSQTVVHDSSASAGFLSGAVAAAWCYGFRTHESLGRRYEIGIRKMSEIHKSLAIFGLEPGASQDAIQRRYKRLIMVWHPDRFPSDDGKKDAEEELKKINNANDVLKKHFASGHRASGCECQKPAAGAEQRTHGQGPGPGPHRKPDDAEAEAKRRDEERKRKAAAEGAARKAAEHQKQQEQKTTQTTFEQAQQQQEQLKWNKIRFWAPVVAPRAVPLRPKRKRQRRPLMVRRAGVLVSQICSSDFIEVFGKNQIRSC